MEQMLNGGPNIFVSNTDKLFIEKTSCPYPVRGPSKKLAEELSSFHLIDGASKEEATRAAKMSTWHTF
jgi:hypothetical protein